MKTKLTSNRINELLVAPIAVSILLLAVCAPPYLKVEPENVCPGGKVVAKWKTEASNPELSSIPQGVIQTKSVPQSGSETLNIKWDKVPSNGKFEVSADGVKDEVTVVPASGDSLTMSFSPDCKTGLPNWASSLLPTIWGSDIKIKNVGNFTGREITVNYAGITQTIPSNGTSNAWNGLGLTVGDWAVSTKLEETDSYYEACNPIGGTVTGSLKMHKPPPTIKVIVSYGCP
jgi:hypothetical protein